MFQAERSGETGSSEPARGRVWQVSGNASTPNSAANSAAAIRAIPGPSGLI